MSLFAANHVTINKKLAPSHSTKRLNKDASTFINLYYLIFMKKLTTASYSSAFKRGRTCISPKDVDAVAPDLLKEFSYTYKISMKGRYKTSSSSVSSIKQQAIFTSDENEKSEEGRGKPSDEGIEDHSDEVGEQTSEEGSGEPSDEGIEDHSDEAGEQTSEEGSGEPSNEDTEEMDYVDDDIVSETDEE